MLFRSSLLTLVRHLLWALGRGPLYSINGVNISDKESLLSRPPSIFSFIVLVRTP